MRNPSKTVPLFRPFSRTERIISLCRGLHSSRSQGQRAKGSHPKTPALRARLLHVPSGADDSLFNYTSGRWLYDEQRQLARRHVRFDADALQQIAARRLNNNTRCLEITKLPEGLYNKVFSLKMENGKEILARIPIRVLAILVT